MADQAPTSYVGEYGIETSLEGYTIEQLSETSTPQREIVYDQFNRRQKEIRYDTLKEISLTVRGQNAPADTGLTLGSGNSSVKFIVDSVEKAGTYNGLRRFNIRAHRTDNCDTETALATS